MNENPANLPFQFGLKHIFALTVAAALMVWLFGPTIVWLVSRMQMFAGLGFLGFLVGLANVIAIRLLQRAAGLEDA